MKGKTFIENKEEKAFAKKLQKIKKTNYKSSQMKGKTKYTKNKKA
jgi:hypothetical protein